jgi:hypothetical protein
MTPKNTIKAPKIEQSKKSRVCRTFEGVDPRKLKPCPENEKIYRPINSNDASIIKLTDSIASKGILNALVITQDNYIVSGHRRREAAISAGLETVPVVRMSIVRGDGKPSTEFVELLVEHNEQRIKSSPELMRELAVKINPTDAYNALLHHRKKDSEIEAETVYVAKGKPRKKIRDKKKLAQAAIDVVNDLRRYWPVSDRAIHYKLLNCPPPLNDRKPNELYRNEKKSYDDLTDILTRLRVEGRIPMDAIDDPTRATVIWAVHENIKDFIDEELNSFLTGYRRNLQQSQPHHLEILAEKLTIKNIIQPVCGRFNIPLTIARGYPSLPARSKMVNRFRRSGKEKMVLLTLSDFDPEGFNIVEATLQYMRSDFGLSDEIQAIRAGLNAEQIDRFKLPQLMEAKESSSRYGKFFEQYGKFAHELEALQPGQLKTILTEAIDSIIDISAFNFELDEEKKNAHYLGVVREQVRDAVLKLDFNEDDECI